MNARAMDVRYVRAMVGVQFSAGDRTMCLEIFSKASRDSVTFRLQCGWHPTLHWKRCAAYGRFCCAIALFCGAIEAAVRQ